MYDPALAQAICDRVADGASLRTACFELGAKHSTFLRWCDGDEKLADQYARARATGADAEFEDLSAIQAEVPERGPSGAVDAAWVAWKRLQIGTMRWQLGKKAAKKYGDKVTQEHTGPGGGPVQVQSIAIELVKPASAA